MRVARSVAAVALATVAVVVVVPSPVGAAPTDPAKIEAVTEIEPDAWPSKVEYTVRPGEVVPAPLGVQSVDPRPVRGLVAQVRPTGDLEFARRYRNCWYTRDADGEMAWCSFAAVLAPYATLAITAPMVAAKPDARPGRDQVIAFRWQSRTWADDRGGLREVVDFFAAPGAPVVAGTGGVLGLAERDLPVADIRANGNHVTVHTAAGTVPPTVTPTVTPTATATGVGTVRPQPSRSPSAAAAGGSGGAAGLPVTGPHSALAGAALLLAGLLGYTLTRRRRNRFEA